MTQSPRLRKLELRKEAVAVLSNAELRGVVGGQLNPAEPDRFPVSILNTCP
ncbi:MAG TPA: class I lanthipeptide [Kofleriaceae bacterium]|nr:class I lanthipeptide [Kofleriaceae bacterium]